MAKEKVFNFMGHKIPIKSEEECAKAEFMLCCTKAMYDKDPNSYVQGTKGGYFCIACNEELVMAPSGQRIAAMGNNRQICMTCALKIQDDENKESARGKTIVTSTSSNQ